MDKTLAVQLLKQMMEIRQFEDKIMELLAKNVAEGGSHLYAGMEAVAVGAISALRTDDYITSTHRGHGHAIAKDGDLKALMAEILGRKTGVCKGKGGSLHLADVSKGNLGANGVVGGSIGLATGAGLSIKMKKTDQVVLCFFGDGATNQGIFYESLNIASLWQLPVIYICENNFYGMSVSVKRASAVQDLSKKALAFDMPAETVDGMDVLAVRESVSRRVNQARSGQGPSFIVANTYRYYGHSRSDPRVYRTREEEKFWRERDPIPNFSRKMIEQGILSQEEVTQLEEQVKQAIEEATEYAIDSPWPEPEELYTDLYA
ncbi:MAG: thiamine pyrophosphate-dependent enzyme [Candidatus Omnitrophica bacterium]|nr:thiamine pyrophosphate-dependent enzyme [Candidatus Omnitrophota bacterium]